MIGLGAKYLTAAGFGRYRITAASLGNLDLLGTWRWLSQATLQAILGAFGQTDGKAVINATNAYLTQLAASDRDKATALAALINEDPMMVCSLGLSVEGVTMPIRWLVGDGNTHIVSGVKSLPTTTAKCKVLYNSSNSIRMDLFGARSDGENQYAFYVSYNEDWGSVRMRYINGSNTQGNIVLNNGMHEIELRPNQFICDGTTYSAGTNSGTQYDLIVMGVRFNATNNGQGMKGQGMAYLDLKNTTGGDRLFIPFIGQNRDGMVDLVAGVFHPNQGTGHFTDAYTLQDGVTPWTPSTP